MADTTSVGVIQLDVEINPKSLNLEIDKLSKAFNNSFKNMFSGMARQNNNFIKESISNIGNSFRAFAQTGTGSSEKVSKSVSKMNSEYEKTEAKISKIRSELEQLFAAQDAIIRNYQDMPALSGMTKDESLEHMLKSNPEFNKLSAQIDKLISELDPLVAKNKKLANEIKNVGDKADNTGNKFNKMGNSAKKAGKSIFNLSWLKRMFTNESKKASKAASNFGNTMNRVSRMIARNLIVYGLIIKGLKGMISYMWSAFKTNQQFAYSLNVIKTNLMTAFQPIYNFVLPALNALMQAVATVTTYIASAISALFGKTYQQSFNAAKGMNKQIEGMKGMGKAAKKAGKEAKGALMGFDEINQLDIKDDSDSGSGGGAGGFEMEMPDLATIDISGIERFKEIMGQIFEPFKKAWENEGQNTINAMKYALEEIKELIKAIGKSWLEVWSNGTGQKVLENILKIFQNILNIVGNLAGALKIAWQENNAGTRIIQNIFDIFNNILETIKKITGSTAEWAKTLDFTPLLESINKMLEALKPLTKNLGDGLAWLWENALLPIAGWVIEDAIPVFLDLLSEALTVLNNVIDALKPLGQWLWDNFLQPLAEWTGGVVISVLEGIKDALKGIGDWIKDHQGVVQTMAIIVGSFAAAWGLVNAAMAIWNVVGVIATGVTSAFGAAVAFLTSPIGIAVLAIGGLIAVGTLLYKHWDEISEWLKEVWEGIKKSAEEIWTAIKEFFIETWNSIKEKTSETWDSIKTKTSEIWNAIKTFLVETIWNPIKTAAKTIWEGIKKVIIDPIQSAWTWLKETWDKIKKYILDKWNEIKTGISSMKDNLVNAIKEPFNIAKNWIDGIIGDAFNWGKNLIGNFIDGIKSMARKVTDAVSGVVGGIKDFLGFSSPTKKGPGSDADKWMPNMMEMFAAGIEDNIAQVSSAINMTAGTIQQGVQPNTDDMASAVGSAVLQSMQMVGTADSGESNREIIIELDGTKLGRVMLPKLNEEAGRLGYKPILETD